MTRQVKRLSPVDREALERALKIARGDPEERAVIDRVMERDGWFAAAVQAVYHCQRPLIAPRLWQPMPHDVEPAEIETILARGDDGVNGEFAAAKLLKKMLSAGLSRYEPDPIRALAAAKERQQRAGSEPEPAPEPAG